MSVSINGTTGITTPGIINSGNESVTGNSSVSGSFSIAGNNVSPVQSFRNKIINGNFDFWQRSTSSSTAGYIDDRWNTGRTGSTFTTSRQSFTLGQTAVPSEPTYFHRTVVTTSSGSAANFTATFASLSKYSYTVLATGLTTGRGLLTGIAALTAEL